MNAIDYLVTIFISFKSIENHWLELPLNRSVGKQLGEVSNGRRRHGMD